MRLRPWLFLPLLVGGFDCYSRGDGTPPPHDVFYYPVGLKVSANGSVLYVVNSDFDLQYNGGTIQSYDLQKVREAAVDLLAHPPAGCPDVAAGFRDDGSGTRQPLGEQCAPPRDSRPFFRRAVVVGAFATDLQISAPPELLIPSFPPSGPPCAPDGTCQGGLACTGRVGLHNGTCEVVGSRTIDRLFVPVRGNASITWVDTTRDEPGATTPADPTAFYAPFELDCAQDSDGRCSGSHAAGTNPYDNSRFLTMPGEPFGMTISDDGESLLVTHQADTKVSLFSTGLSRTQNDPMPLPPPPLFPPPTLDFVLDGFPGGGNGLAAVPHDREGFPGASFPNQAYLWTTRSAAEVDLIRRYPDQANSLATGFDGGAPDPNVGASSLARPFIDREQIFPILPSAGGSDSRGIAIDPTPRLACKARVAPAGGTRTQADVDAEILACAHKPARVFIANRSPASLIVGEIGGDAPNGGAYDPDRLTLHSSIPMRAGPSNVYLAPIVDRDGSYALRVFVTCFDSSEIFIFDPDTQLIENEVRVGPGPFALAFDPFRFEDVATNAPVPADPRYSMSPDRKTLRKYRFAYSASFTQSFVELIDLDNGEADRTTYERVVFTLGNPTNPLENQNQ